MIIAVDYDGTLETNGAVNALLVERLRRDQLRGACVILWTCRAGARLAEALQRLAEHGFRPSLVNANAPAAVARLGYDPRKIIADVYIDDKAVKP